MDDQGLWLLVASTVDGGFAIDGLPGADRIVAGASTAVGSIIGGSDDLVVARGNLATWFVEDGVLDYPVLISSYQAPVYGGANSKWGVGDPLALLWFPTQTTASTILAEGTEYGFYTSAVAVDESRPWVSPVEPTSGYILTFYTQDGDVFSPGAAASNPASAGNANLKVIPEPSALLLAILGAPMCGMIRARRR